MKERCYTDATESVGVLLGLEWETSCELVVNTERERERKGDGEDGAVSRRHEGEKGRRGRETSGLESEAQRKTVIEARA